MNNIRSVVNNIFILLFNHIKINKILKEKNITNIKKFHFKRWHFGYAYFTGILNDKKVFIKIDTQLHLLQNDLLVYQLANKELKKYLVEIVEQYISDDIQIIVYSYMEGKELTSDIIIEKEYLIEEIISILKIISNLEIIHRDIKLDNFFLVNEELKIIDFTFAYSLNSHLNFKELKLSNKNCNILSSLGIGLNPKPFLWNDSYSLKSILKKINLKDIENYINKINDIKSDNYSICCSKFYYKSKKVKKIIKGIFFYE